MKDDRPVNLDIRSIRFPLPAITSILHRISGVILFAGIALLLYLLELSLESEAGFQRAVDLIAIAPVRFLLWVLTAALLYHLIAGIKHLLMDLGIGESLRGARIGAIITLLGATLAIILAGAWMW